MDFNSMSLRVKATLFIDVCIAITCILVCVTGYIIASGGFNEAYTDRVHGGASYIKMLLETKYEGNWEVRDGKLYRGEHAMDEESDFLDSIAGEDAITVYNGDTRFATTIKGENGQRAVGTKAASEVVEHVINTGESYTLRTDILGKPFFACYEPLKDANGQNVGMLFYGAPADYVSSMESKFIWYSVLAALVFILISGFIITRAISYKMRSLEDVQQAMNMVANGDLGISDLPVNGNDELDRLAADTNNMKNAVRKLMSNISDSAQVVASSSQQLTASASQTAESVRSVANSATVMADNSGEQRSQLENTAYMIERMSFHVDNLNKEFIEMRQVADDSLNGAKEGQNVVNQAVKAMENISAQIQESSQSVIKLGEQSKEIGQVVDTIAGIAGQTNLLALNAAIEAARAGEAGRGFAVVAEEVRKLAEQSEAATHSIADIIGAIQVDTSKAVEAMLANGEEIKKGNKIVENTGSAFANIAEKIEVMHQKMAVSTRSVRHVRDRSVSINEAIGNVNNLGNKTASEAENVSAATEEQAAMMDEIAEASNGMADMAQKLQEEVNKFKL